MDSVGNFIIVWEDGKNLKAQRFYPDLSKKGDIFQINTISASGIVTNIYPHVRLYNGKIYTSWSKSEGDNSSVWMNILDFDNPVDIDDKTELPKEYSLSQYYPNPFNPSTTINYSVLSNVKIIVYDILGCEVATLVNENKPAGNYEITFNVGQASSLSS